MPQSLCLQTLIFHGAFAFLLSALQLIHCDMFENAAPLVHFHSLCTTEIPFRSPIPSNSWSAPVHASSWSSLSHTHTQPSTNISPPTEAVAPLQPSFLRYSDSCLFPMSPSLPWRDSLSCYRWGHPTQTDIWGAVHGCCAESCCLSRSQLYVFTQGITNKHGIFATLKMVDYLERQMNLNVPTNVYPGPWPERSLFRMIWLWGQILERVENSAFHSFRLSSGEDTIPL